MNETQYLIDRQENLLNRLSGLKRERSNAWVWFWILFLFVIGLIIAIIVLLVKIIPVNEQIRKTESLIRQNEMELRRVGLNQGTVNQYNEAKKEAHVFNNDVVNRAIEYEGPRSRNNEPRTTRKRQNERRN